MPKDKYVVSTVDVTLRDPATDQVLAHSRTLMNAVMEQIVQTASIYGGKGAQKQFTFDYQKELNVTVEDCEFKEEIIAFNNGVLVTNGTVKVQKTERITLDASGQGTLAETPVGKVGLIDESTGAISNVTATDKNVTDLTLAGKTVLALYEYNSVNTDHIVIDADKYSGTYVLVMDADLYMKGTGQVKVGSVQVKVDRFKLSGNQTFTFDMSNPFTTGFSGSALSHNGRYATVSIIRDSADVMDEILDLWLSPDSETLDLSDGDTVTVIPYGYRGSGRDVIVNPPGVTFASSDTTKAEVDEEGVVTPQAAGSATITASLTVGTKTLTGTCQITVVE
jgi:hypothetical protein